MKSGGITWAQTVGVDAAREYIEWEDRETQDGSWQMGMAVKSKATSLSIITQGGH
jgi:hypothetical protein